MRAALASHAGIAELDPAPRCQLGHLDTGFRCALRALAYVEFHMVGHCQRFDCDLDGNACGFVCAIHLDALEYTAECTAAESQSTAPWPRGTSAFGSPGRCSTCDRPVFNAAHILQVVVML